MSENIHLESVEANYLETWEILIRCALESQQSITKSVNEEDLREELFARYIRGMSVPVNQVGVGVERNFGRIDYFCKFFIGHPQRFGRIIVAEPILEARNQHSGISGPVFLAGVLGLHLSERYDSTIVQSAANVYSAPVLHSIEVGYGRSERKRLYLARDYTVRPGYGQIVDKIYNPE